MKEYRIMHWDTFDNETIEVAQTRTLDEAIRAVHTKYGNRVCGNGADRVDIIDRAGNVLRKYSVR